VHVLCRDGERPAGEVGADEVPSHGGLQTARPRPKKFVMFILQKYSKNK
jgi:hypothetical protein